MLLANLRTGEGHAQLQNAAVDTEALSKSIDRLQVIAWKPGDALPQQVAASVGDELPSD